MMAVEEAQRLPGAHNWQNMALAYAATRIFVKDPRVITAAIASFPGLAHRMEDVSRIGKTRFINDSKATNADAAHVLHAMGQARERSDRGSDDTRVFHENPGGGIGQRHVLPIVRAWQALRLFPVSYTHLTL